MKTDICTFMIYLAEFFSEREMLQSKSCEENQNTHFILDTFFLKMMFMRMCRRAGQSQQSQMTTQCDAQNIQFARMPDD
jgi:hypothetical protein